MLDHNNDEKRIKTVTLTLTQSCNLNCTYCYEQNKSKNTMSIETAKQIIDYEIETSHEFEGIEFDLFGGEPFLEFDLIREITEYLCSKKSQKNSIAFATVNAEN